MSFLRMYRGISYEPLTISNFSLLAFPLALFVFKVDKVALHSQVAPDMSSLRFATKVDLLVFLRR